MFKLLLISAFIAAPLVIQSDATFDVGWKRKRSVDDIPQCDGERLEVTCGSLVPEVALGDLKDEPTTEEINLVCEGHKPFFGCVRDFLIECRNEMADENLIGVKTAMDIMASICNERTRTSTIEWLMSMTADRKKRSMMSGMSIGR